MEAWRIILAALAWLGWGLITALVVGSLMSFALWLFDKMRRK